MEPDDTLAAWCSAHQEELKGYAGQYVALSPKTGVLAHGTTFPKVHEEAVRKDAQAVFLLAPDTEVMVLCLR